MPKFNYAALPYREWWTPGQAAWLLGKGVSFWRDAFDRGLVEGRRDGKWRWLKAESARNLLDRQNSKSRQAELVRSVLKKWRESK